MNALDERLESTRAASMAPPNLGEYDADLHESWRPYSPGLLGWLMTGDHKRLGKLQITTAFIFFLLGGLEAMLMRIQLIHAENRLLSPDLYDQIFTTHGTTMMFLFAVPVLQGFGMYFVPLMIGSRCLVFPRLAALAYWVYLFAGIMLYTGFFLNIAPDAGWFAYPPLSLSQFSPGKHVDYWAQMITLTEVSAMATAVDIAVTILKLRAPGMSITRMPLFVWAMFVQSIMVMLAMPAVATASALLAADRSTLMTQFFNPGQNGDAILYQHLFWYFGHPEVYLIFIPALGFVSTIIQTFTGRSIFGYPVLVLSLIATAFIGFGVWVHHMFTIGLPQLGQSFFTAATLMVALPTTVQITCWIVSLWRGRPRFTTSLLFILGFFQVLVMGGLTGVMLSSIPFNTQVHDTYFVVAHFHYVLIGGAVFPLFGAVYYWFPKITGRFLNEAMGKANFWTFLIGFNLTFFPMHILGYLGMPRRVYTYVPQMGWDSLNFLAAMGACLLFLSVVLFLMNALTSLRAPATAPDNPWNGESLEWATSSPPPHYNFKMIPVVEGRDAMWNRSDPMPVVAGVPKDKRETLSTTILDAVPEHLSKMPGSSPFPFLLAIVTAAGMWGIVYSVLAWWPFCLFSGILLIGWYYRNSVTDDSHISGF